MERITLNTTVQDVLNEYPELIRVFEQRAIQPDLECLGVTENTIQDASAVCNFDPQEMLDDLNRALERLRG